MADSSHVDTNIITTQTDSSGNTVISAVQTNVTESSRVDSFVVSGGMGVTDHGALTGLADDDHTQYALADGTRGTFATTAQGALADSALQSADIANFETTTQLNSRDTANRNTDNHTSGTTNKVYTAAEQTKLAAISGTNTGDDATNSQYSGLAASKQDTDPTLTALAAYNTNGILTQTAADTFTGRTITGTTNQITVTNGDGVGGNPTLALPNAITLPGTITGANLTGTNTGDNLIIGTSAPTPAVGERVLWLDTTGGNITLNLVTGD